MLNFKNKIWKLFVGLIQIKNNKNMKEAFQNFNLMELVHLNIKIVIKRIQFMKDSFMKENSMELVKYHTNSKMIENHHMELTKAHRKMEENNLLCFRMVWNWI